MRILTFDIEEWFHLLDNPSTKTENEWEKYEVRIYQNVDKILEILEKTDTKATFFIIGWIAKKYPDIVKRISEKYEIGSHTCYHQLVWQQNQKEFKEDLSASIKLLEDISGKPVKYFRAPGFSIRTSELWAFEAIKECGIEIDCSIFPAHHAHGGIPLFPKPYPSIIQYKGIKLKEFPCVFKNIGKHHIVFSGGGYFRIIPYWLLKKWTSKCNEYLLSYIHPRDLDATQPMIKDLPLKRKFRSYIGIKNAANKLEKWLTDFDFTDIETADKSFDWNKAQIVNFDQIK